MRAAVSRTRVVGCSVAMSTARSKAHRLGEMQGFAETDGSFAKAIIHVGGKHVPEGSNVVFEPPK
jgi:hypothetical protein